MEKAATFHSPNTPPGLTSPTTTTKSTSNHRKKRSHTVTLPKLPFHRSSNSTQHPRAPTFSKSTLSSPLHHAPPNLPLPSLPFLRGHGSNSNVPSRRGSVSKHDGSEDTSRVGSSAGPGANPGPEEPGRKSLGDKIGAYPAQVALLPRQKQVGRGDVEREKRLLGVREGEVGAALERLNARAHGETRRLDDVYYDLLSRAGGLRELVGRLEALYGELEEGRGEFEMKAGELEGEHHMVVEGWKGFEDREGVIVGLVRRLEEARERGKRAEDRLGVLRERVEGWEREEVQRGKGRKWWLVFSGWIAVTLVLLLLGLLVWRGIPGGFEGVDEWGSGWTEAGGQELAMREKIGIRLAVDERLTKKEEKRGKRWRGILDEL
ncbi:hypothetical protein B9Z65_4073 [Elsinoe australis]|uniref:Uncharacterized protein n=1 Tax=Elsinoe australis TaxID=40998 RepID=A0A2P7Z1R8_9PEZI|nr:hypothetical protein B9Z65_4073 [Elsinoe australis]